MKSQIIKQSWHTLAKRFLAVPGRYKLVKFCTRNGTHPLMPPGACQSGRKPGTTKVDWLPLGLRGWMAPRVVLLPEDLASTVHEIGREKETDLDLLLYKRIRNHCSNTQLTLLFDVNCLYGWYSWAYAGLKILYLWRSTLVKIKVGFTWSHLVAH